VIDDHLDVVGLGIPLPKAQSAKALVDLFAMHRRSDHEIGTPGVQAAREGRHLLPRFERQTDDPR
jgi:hypothetical protein